MPNITLEDLKKASRRGLLNLSKLSRLIGFDRRTLRARIQRGSPEITNEEAERIRRELEQDGISLGAP